MKADNGNSPLAKQAILKVWTIRKFEGECKDDPSIPRGLGSILHPTVFRLQATQPTGSMYSI